MLTRDELTRRLTIAEYESDLGMTRLSGHPSEKWQSFKRELEEEMQKGGELWEWESEGFRNLRGSAGLAILRNNEIIKSWQLWKS